MKIEVRVKALILEQYGTMVEFSKRTGIPSSTLLGILKRGLKNSNAGSVLTIASALGVSADELAADRITPVEIARIRAESGADREDTKAELIAAEIAHINARRARYAELYGSGLYSHEELHDMIFPLTEQVEKLQQELEGIRSEEQKRQEKRANEVLKTVGDVLDRGDRSEVRAVIEALIRRIEIDGEDIFIFWRF